MTSFAFADIFLAERAVDGNDVSECQRRTLATVDNILRTGLDSI